MMEKPGDDATSTGTGPGVFFFFVAVEPSLETIVDCKGPGGTVTRGAGYTA